MPLVESQVGPAGQQPQPREERCDLRSENQTANGIEQQKQGGEMFHAHLDQAFEDGNRMLGNELLEGDEEGRLDGYATTYLR